MEEGSGEIEMMLKKDNTTLLNIKHHISNTLLNGRSPVENNLVTEDPRNHPKLLESQKSQYKSLDIEDKIEVMDLLAGLISIHDGVQIVRKEKPRLSDSRLVCSRKKKPIHFTNLKIKAREDNSYGCKFSCTLNHTNGILTFADHCEYCQNNKDPACIIENKLKVLQQITSPTKVLLNYILKK